MTRTQISAMNRLALVLMVVIGCWASAAQPEDVAVIEIHPSECLQTIEGFGASGGSRHCVFVDASF